MLSLAIRQARQPILRRAATQSPIILQLSRGYAKDRRSRHNHRIADNFKSAQQGQPFQRRSDGSESEPIASHIRDSSKTQKPELAKAPDGLTEDLLSTSDVTTPKGEEPQISTNPAETSIDRPLPDLTQGIPSTLEYEGTDSQKAGHASLVGLNLTEDPDQPATGGGRDGGELPKSAYISSLERKRQRLVKYMLATLALMSITGGIYLGRNWETEEEEKSHVESPSGWGFGLFYRRVKARINGLTDLFTEPAFPKLLPDPDPQWARTHTLVISLEDMLLHSEWSREHGWRMAKRPGVDYFLRYLSQYYELVIWSSVPWAIGDPIVRKFDPFRIVTWPLFREATRYINGDHVKDLSYLNRDPSKIILMDTVEGHAKLQPENAIILPKWTGDPKDKELVSYIPFLEYVVTMGGNDTRKVLESFKDSHIPAEYARRENLARKKLQEQLQNSKRPVKSGLGLLGSALGLNPQSALIEGEQLPSEAYAQGKLPQDQIRERAQKQYELIEKEIRENSEKWLKELAAEEERMKQEQMKLMVDGMRGGLGGWIRGERNPDT